MSRHFDLFSRENLFDRQSLFSQTPTQNITPEKHLERGSKRHSKERTDDSANDQAPRQKSSQLPSSDVTQHSFPQSVARREGLPDSCIAMKIAVTAIGWVQSPH